MNGTLITDEKTKPFEGVIEVINDGGIIRRVAVVSNKMHEAVPDRYSREFLNMFR